MKDSGFVNPSEDFSSWIGLGLNQVQSAGDGCSNLLLSAAAVGSFTKIVRTGRRLSRSEPVSISY